MKRIFSALPRYLALVCFSLFALVPFQYMFATAMTPQSYSMPYPPILFSKSWYWGNFVEAWNANHFSQYPDCGNCDCDYHVCFISWGLRICANAISRKGYTLLSVFVFNDGTNRHKPDPAVFIDERSSPC